MSDELAEEAVDTDIDLHQLALEWAACRRALTQISDLTDEERDAFAMNATVLLLGLENAA